MPDYTALHVSGHDVWLPARLAARDEAREAVEALLGAAVPHVNHALAAQANGRILEALRAVATALRLAPHSARVVELGILLATKHGAFADAQARLRWAETTGMSAGWPDYAAALGDAVTRWNQFVADTEALRAHYQAPGASASYRELLLLADRLAAPGVQPPPSDAERAHLAAVGLTVPEVAPEPTPAPEPEPKPERSQREPERTPAPPRSRRPLVAAGLAGALGLLVGLGGAWATGVLTPATPSTAEPAAAAPAPPAPPSDVSASTAEGLSVAAALARAHLDLLQGRPLEAYAALDTLQAERPPATKALADLRDATQQALYDAGLAAWDRRATAEALRLLVPLADADVGVPQERLYALGMAAAEEGRTDLAIRALRRLQDHLTPAYRHYDAQAAYTLVTLLPDAEATPYAKRIATRYPNTIYNNSVVQAHL